MAASTSTLASAPQGKILTAQTINPRVLAAKYAVRGELVIRAEEYKKTLRKQKEEGTRLLPFDEILHCNIGNPQELGQKPLTFMRQVVSLMEYPELLEHPRVGDIYPMDVIARARRYLAAVGSTGAYSNSQGLPVVREEVAKFIAARDGFAADPENIFLTDGASPGVQAVMRISLRDERDSVLIPIPQYPLYSASIPLFGGSQLEYFLNEETGWGLEVAQLEAAVKRGRDKGLNPRALVVINPGNPTGQCLSEENMRHVIEFCAAERLVLLADEVYQENVYAAGKQWHSFKKVLRTMEQQAAPGSAQAAALANFEMISFHSISKGFMGECGKRGGYFECVGIDAGVKAELYKLASISLCPNVVGQVMMGLKVNPPAAGDASYELYAKERDAILASLASRATNLVAALNKLEGVTCNDAEGAMYAFPRISLPAKAVAAAKDAGVAPDMLYARQLLEETGIVVVPGSGFGQKDGTFHFRTTFLPAPDKIASVIERLGKFHVEFMNRFRG